jgi:inorganic pyrophosphatase
MTHASTFSRWRPHPWHGLDVGPNPPQVVNAFIEITPFEYVKYELDKQSGYLFVDRPHRTSSLPPTLYGFIPRTYCAQRVRELMPHATQGDGDPLDICVISERPINRNEVILRARVVGGLPMLDADEADDKIIAVLKKDSIWGHVEDVRELPEALVARLRHYFSTYKLPPSELVKVQIDQTYGPEHAFEVIRAAMADYEEHFGKLAEERQ